MVDVALHSRTRPVAAKALAARHGLPPRHLETLLQALVHANVLRGVRGPMGGYELARERRGISMADIVRATDDAPGPGGLPGSASSLVSDVIAPIIETAGRGFLGELETVTIHDLCMMAGARRIFGEMEAEADFHI